MKHIMETDIAYSLRQSFVTRLIPMAHSIRCKPDDMHDRTPQSHRSRCDRPKRAQVPYVCPPPYMPDINAFAWLATYIIITDQGSSQHGIDSESSAARTHM